MIVEDGECSRYSQLAGDRGTENIRDDKMKGRRTDLKTPAKLCPKSLEDFPVNFGLGVEPELPEFEILLPKFFALGKRYNPGASIPSSSRRLGALPLHKNRKA